MNKYLLFPLFFVLLFVQCKSPTANDAPKQGIKGKLLWVEGNQMPGPGKEMQKGLPVKREVYICKPLKTSNLNGTAPVFEALPASEVVKIINTAEDGSFTVDLPVGEYSIFTKEEGGYFANKMNGQGILNSVSVVENKLTEFELVINYKAVY